MKPELLQAGVGHPELHGSQHNRAWNAAPGPQSAGSPAPCLDLQLPPVTWHFIEEKRGSLVHEGGKWVNNYSFNQAETSKKKKNPLPPSE